VTAHYQVGTRMPDPGAIERIRDDFRAMATQLRNTALRQWAPSAALVGATAIWGSTFVVTKDATEQMSVLGFLTWRFGIAAALLLVFGWREIRAMSTVVRRRSVVIGVFLGSGFIAQTYGLQATTAAVSSFVTGLMVVLTPVVASLLFGERVTRPAWRWPPLGWQSCRWTGSPFLLVPS
jgi:hypothetical protein